MIAPVNVKRNIGIDATREWDLPASGDFAQARRRARWHTVLNTVSGRSNRLLTLEEYLSECIPGSQFDEGVQVIPLNEIKGSVGRDQDFDRSFMPRGSHLRDRWLRVDQAYRQGHPLPAIDVVLVEGEYFVVDGHHRVSVARQHGQTYIDAHVVRVQPVCPVERSEEESDRSAAVEGVA